jgi:hypothetical protein
LRLLPQLVAAALLVNFAQVAAAALVVETWESQGNTDPFTGTGDLSWSGDVGAWAITTETWPTSPAQDFAGDRSLRSSNHGSVEGGPRVVETVVTDISSAVNLSRRMQWDVFFSGNSAFIQPNRRADFVLLSDSSNVGLLEDPLGLNGFKLTLWDPYADGTDNVPPSSHEAAALADSLTLWSVDSTDDRWRVLGSMPLGSTDNLRDGWNVRAVRETTGEWFIGFANGAIGNVPTLTSMGFDPFSVSVFTGSIYGGIGWTAPNNTTNDHTDFGFDNFQVQSAVVPEAASLVVWALLFTSAGLGCRLRRGR